MRFVDSAHAAVTMSELMSDAVGDGLWFWFVVAFDRWGFVFAISRGCAPRGAHAGAVHRYVFSVAGKIPLAYWLLLLEYLLPSCVVCVRNSTLSAETGL